MDKSLLEEVESLPDKDRYEVIDGMEWDELRHLAQQKLRGESTKHKKNRYGLVEGRIIDGVFVPSEGK